MHSTKCLITINKDGIVKTVDKNTCKLFGFELDELVGHSVKLIIPSPYKDQHDLYMKNYLETKIPKIIGKSRMVEGQHKDGSIFPIKLSVTKIGEGDEIVFFGVIDKLDERAALITINSAGFIVSCNQAVEELFEFKANELIGQNVNMIMASPHKELHNSYIQSYLAGGPAKVIGQVRNFPAKTKSGVIFPISLQVEKLNVGAIQLFRGKIEKVDVMEAVFTLDESGKVIQCNQNFVQALFGYTNSEIVGKNISILIPSIHHNTNSDLFASASNSNINGSSGGDENGPEKKKRKVDGEPSLNWRSGGTHKKEMLHKDGSCFPVILEINPFQNDDNTKQYSVRIKRAEMTKESSNQSQKSIGKYYVVKTVGKGSYGKVKLALHKETKEEYAIKVLHKGRMKQPELERTRREIEILSQLIHPHIAKLLDVIETDDHMNIVMEYAGRTLLSFVLEKSGLGEVLARKFFLQLLSAVKYCHDRNIIHRDIKHQNILLDDKDNCKLIDFGLSNFKEEGKLRSTFCGTPAYAAPEMILGKKYTGPEVDIWSMGVVLYSMITGVFPFENVNDIIRGSFKDPKNSSAECCELLRKMLQVDINDRFNLTQIENHAWVKNEVSKITTPNDSEIQNSNVTSSSSSSSSSSNNSNISSVPSSNANGGESNISEEAKQSPVKEIECTVVEQKIEVPVSI